MPDRAAFTMIGTIADVCSLVESFSLQTWSGRDERAKAINQHSPEWDWRAFNVSARNAENLIKHTGSCPERRVGRLIMGITMCRSLRYWTSWSSSSRFHDCKSKYKPDITLVLIKLGQIKVPKGNLLLARCCVSSSYTEPVLNPFGTTPV